MLHRLIGSWPSQSVVLVFWGLALWALLFTPLFATGISDSAHLELRVAEVPGAERCAQGGFLIATPFGPDETASEGALNRRLPFKGPGKVSLELPANRAWRISAELEDCWMPPVELPLEPERFEAQRTLWPTASVLGQVTFPDFVEGDGTTPREVTVRFASPPEDSAAARRSDSVNDRVAEHHTTCAMEQNHFQCSLPATSLDMRASANALIPVYLWDVRPVVGEEIDPGPLTLRRGASLVGWVEVTGRHGDLDDVEVVFEPDVFDGTQSAAGQRLAGRQLRVGVQPRGFFQLAGLADGAYRLTLHKPGYSSAHLDGIAIAGGTEHVLGETLTLRPLTELQVFVTPPLDPTGAAWTLHLRRWLPQSRYLDDGVSGRATAGGSWQLGDLTAGAYQLEIEDAGGSRHASQQVDLDADSPAVHVELDFVRLSGWVHADGEPLEGKLSFQGSTGSRIFLPLDEHGKFEGILPREGSWRVRWTPTEGRGQRFLTAVDVVRQDDGTAFVHIDLPATRISGVVLDADDEGVADALVNFWADGQIQAQLYSDEEGAFRVVGLPEVAVDLSAEVRGGRMSQGLTLDLAEDEIVDDVELKLQDKKRLRGVVTFEGRPVAGASVRSSSPESPPFAREVLAGPRGQFDLQVPPHVQALDLIVLAPGLPVKMTRVHTSKPTTEVDLTIGPRPGRLVLSLHQPPWIRRGQGGFVQFQQLVVLRGNQPPRGLDLATGTLELAIEPGEYTVCPSAQVSSHCSSGYLAPDGLLSLGISRDSEDVSPSTRGR